MFSGIVEETACISSVDQKDPLRITVESCNDQNSTQLGDSVAINGVCLTVVEKKENNLSFEVAMETIRRTTLGALKNGDRVNLERSLKIGDRLHGHFVFGHVDSTVKLLAKEQDGGTERLVWELPAELRRYVVSKGSVSLSGVSLTVGEVKAESFSVYIIPHTLAVTILGNIKIGDRVNLEVDMLARYASAGLGVPYP